MTEAQKTARWGPVIGEYASKRDPDKIYAVRSLSGNLSCNCMEWATTKTCPHVQAAQQNLAALPVMRPVVRLRPATAARHPAWTGLRKRLIQAYLATPDWEGRVGTDAWFDAITTRVLDGFVFEPPDTTTTTDTTPTAPAERGRRVIYLED